VSGRSSADLLARLETYYDAAPRSSARTEEIGPFTLFVTEGGWPYYARPRLGGRPEFSAEDVDRVRARQRELGQPEALEWVAETTPALLDVVRATGLTVSENPLMVLDAPLEIAAPDGVRVRILAADDPAVPAANAVAAVGFGSPGTAAGAAGAAEREAAVAPGDADHVRNRIRRGLTFVAVAEDDTGPIAVGSSQPVDGVTEIVGVATLPVARRRGIGAAVTSALVTDARSRGVDLVFLSAGSDDVARVYARVGFRRVGTACVAQG
jgi:ribosomal protein S18 acetylase RimI-like enzyme